jgi:hypothetical protein
MITETHAIWAEVLLDSGYGDPRERHNALLIIQAWRAQCSETIARMKREAEEKRT